MSEHSDQRVVFSGNTNHHKLQMCLSKMQKQTSNTLQRIASKNVSHKDARGSVKEKIT